MADDLVLLKKMASLSMILAIADNGVIGRGGKLPWDEPDDRAQYEAITRGAAVIMGRRTWEEMGVPLAGRLNIVVSHAFTPPSGVHTAKTLDEAIALAERVAPERPLFVIGGARLFEEGASRADRVYLTEIPGSPEGDTFFDRRIFERAGLAPVSSRTSPSGLRFVVLERR